MNCSYCGTPQIVPDEVPRLRALVDSTERHALKLEAEVERLRADLNASKAMHEDARLLACELHAEVERLREATALTDENVRRIARRLGGWGSGTKHDQVKAVLCAATADVAVARTGEQS